MFVSINLWIVITGGKKLPPTPPVTSAPPTPPPSPPTPSKPQTIHHIMEYSRTPTSTPYPDKGVILQSLNYIQMDVFSSYFNSNQNDTNITVEKTQTFSKREPALVSEALHNIENNFRSLF